MDQTIREGNGPAGAADVTLREGAGRAGATDVTLREGSSTGAGQMNLVPGALFLRYTLLAPLEVTSGEADLWFVRHDQTEYVLKLYRYGREPKAAFFVMVLPYSDAVFVQGPVGHLLPMNPSRDLPPDNPGVRPTLSSPVTHFRPLSLF